MEFQILIFFLLMLTIINIIDSWSTSSKSANFNPMYRESRVDGKKWLNNELFSFSDFVASKPLLSANEEKKLGQAIKLALHLEKVMINIQNESNIIIPNDNNDDKIKIFNDDNNNITYFDENCNSYFSRILTIDRESTNKLSKRLECNEDMIRRIAMNGDKAYETLVNSNLRLVLAVVSRYYYANNIPVSELIAEGVRGLSKAVRRYDFEKGFRFATYATWYVTQGVADYVRFKSNPTKIPSKYLLLRRNLKKFMPEYQEAHKCNPTLKEICEALGSCEVDIVKCLTIQTSATSLNEKLRGGKSTSNTDRTFEDVLQSPSAYGPDLQSSANQLNRDITIAIERNLEKEEKDILQMRLGLGNTRAHTISEVAKKYEISWQKVRHLERQALDKLLNSTDLLMDQ